MTIFLCHHLDDVLEVKVSMVDPQLLHFDDALDEADEKIEGFLIDLAVIRRKVLPLVVILPFFHLKDKVSLFIV